MNVRESHHCLVCNGKLPPPFLSLGEQVPANSFSLTPQYQPKFPLAVTSCQACHLWQLTHIVERTALFSDYAYYTSTSPQLHVHFENYARDLAIRFPARKRVVEIASNDGLLLKYLKSFGKSVLGIDPAANIATTANTDGIETWVKFFDASIANEVIQEKGKADIVIANNVLAHVEDPVGFVKAVRSMLMPNGVFIAEVAYVGDMIANGDFTNVYHEHVMYFSLRSLRYLFQRCGLELFDVQRVKTQGGSLRVFASMTANTYYPSVKKLLSDEAEDIELAVDRSRSKRTLGIINAAVRAGGRTVAYGASAKASVLLQACGLDVEQIAYIVDAAPSKQGRYMPGTRIPIVAPDRLRVDVPERILITAWNYAQSIMAKESWFADAGGKFIVPLPKLEVLP